MTQSYSSTAASSSTPSTSPRFISHLQHIVSTDELPASDDFEWSSFKNDLQARIHAIVADWPSDTPVKLHEEAKRRMTADGKKAQLKATSNGSSTKRHGMDIDLESSEEEEDEIFPSMSSEVPGLSTDNGSSESGHFVYHPAKTAPPADRNGSWGRTLSEAELKDELSLITSMLDEFQSSPPFTIQRLCELLLAPESYNSTKAKFLSSLARILAVTAAHEDFPPISPGQPPFVITNGLQQGGVGSQASTGPPSPGNEPLFSPIPFLRRPGTDQDGQEDAEDVAEVPTLRLDEEASSSKPTASSSTEILSAPVSLYSPQQVQQIQQQQQQQQRLQQANPPASAPAGASATQVQQPLGVPSGRIDELDAIGTGPSDSSSSGVASQKETVDTVGSGEGQEHHMDGAVRPLTSTTTTPVAPTSSVDPTAAKDDDEESTEARAVKRLRSDINLAASSKEEQ